MSQSDLMALNGPQGSEAVEDLYRLAPEEGRRVVADLLRRPTTRSAESLHFAKFEESAVDEEGQSSQGEAALHTSEMEEELKANLTAAREEGLRHAREQFAADLAAGLVEERRKVERVRSDFANDRQRFFAAAETQIVKLALAVAAKILSREVAADSLHLAATVRAALSRVQESSSTTLRVPPHEVSAWTAFFERTPSGKVRVQGDERLAAGDCTLDTTVGRVELGVDVQLQEVARSFGEMLQNPREGATLGEAIGEASKTKPSRTGTL